MYLAHRDTDWVNTYKDTVKLHNRYAARPIGRRDAVWLDVVDKDSAGATLEVILSGTSPTSASTTPNCSRSSPR